MYVLNKIRDSNDIIILMRVFFWNRFSIVLKYFKCLNDVPSSSVGATARCGLWPVEQYLSIFPYLSPTLSIFSLPALEDLFLLLLSIIFWVFPFVSSLQVPEWRSFWASYPPPFSPGDPTNLMMFQRSKIKFQITANKMQCFLIYLFLQMLYMFQAVPPPIIRSTQLYIQLQVLSTNTAASCYREGDGTPLFLQTLYIFQAVPPPIISSTQLYIQLQVLSTNTAASCYREGDGTPFHLLHDSS